MSAKPGTLPRWANVGGAIVVPPAGTQDVGHVAGEQPLHSYENWYKNLVYQWIVWLNDGDVALHNVSATGTLAVTGAATFDGNVTLGNAAGDAINPLGAFTASEGITVPTGKAVAINGSSTLSVGGATTLAAMTASGLVTANAGVTVATGQAVTLSGTATLTVNGTTTLNDNVTLASNKNITFQGTGKIKHPSRGRKIAILGPQQVGTVNTAALTVNFGANPFVIPLGGMWHGERIISITADIVDGIGAASTCRLKLYNNSFAFGAQLVATGSTSSGGGHQQISVSATSTLAPDDEWYAVIERVTGTGTIDVYGCDLQDDSI